jgi:hypothetical protein
MRVVMKGLPAGHSLANCMGVYVEQLQQHNHQPKFVGGRCNDMLLFFETRLGGGWVVTSNKVDLGPYHDIFLQKTGAEMPHLDTISWVVLEQPKVPAPSILFSKFKKRENFLKLTGMQGSAFADFMGMYRKEADTYDGQPTYGNDGLAVWFKQGFGWCAGIEADIGTHNCVIHANDFAPTPDAVHSTWLLRPNPVHNHCVQVVLASTGSCPTPLNFPNPTAGPGQEAQVFAEAHTAQQNALQPLKISVVGVGEGFSGLYAKQQQTQSGRVLYQSSRADEIRAIWYSKMHERWSIGQLGSPGFSSFISVTDSAISPLAITSVWCDSTWEPRSSIRVSKSKKKHTKVIEVKGVPTGTEHMALLNGKYRPQAKIIDGRPTFKGSNHIIWFSEGAGSWRISHAGFEGTAMYLVHAKDTAATPNTVKATWHVGITQSLPNLHANIIVPSVEAAEQEVPRQMHLKMAEVLAAEEKRCLGCGHQYTSQAEVVFHEECSHHHCVCCGEELAGMTCAVCAEMSK